jgi:LacI family transcriptional regulator
MSATLKDVAKLAPSTVSGVLNGTTRVKPETRRRIMQAVEELNYRPNHLARSLRTQGTRTLGLVIPSITNPFYPALARGVEDTANAYGYSVLLSNTDRAPDKEQQYIETLIDKRVDGLILVDSMVPDSLIQEIAQTPNLAIVMMNRGIDSPNVDEIWVDFRNAAIQMTEHLIEAGHHRIAFLAGPRNIWRAEERLLGYQEALSRHKLELDKSLIKYGKFDYESGYELGRELLAQGDDFTAVFASNDLMAIGCMTALQDSGIPIPHDVSVVGFDDIDLAFFVRPKLSTVYQPNYEMGTAAVRLIMERIRQERNVKTRQELTTRLVMRESMIPHPSPGG